MTDEHTTNIAIMVVSAIIVCLWIILAMKNIDAEPMPTDTVGETAR